MIPKVNRKLFSSIIKLKINSKGFEFQQGTLLIDAIQQAGFKLPYICYHPDLPTSGGICRVCVVKDLKLNQIIVSCKTEVKEGMDISTMDQTTNDISRTNTALMFSYHPSTCISCPSSGNCWGQNICNASGLRFSSALNEIAYNQRPKDPPQHIGAGAMMKSDNSSNIVKTKELCINCDRCIRTCEWLEGIGVYGWVKTENGHSVGAYGPSKNNECIQCGQCINRCPVGALSEKSMIEDVRRELKDPEKLVVFQTAPAVRVAIGEEFGMEPGAKIMKNELVEGLKLLGNCIVVDTNFGADLTIMEEANELLHRLVEVYRDGKSFSSLMPMITSCSPGWVHYLEKHYPQYMHKLSSCKSPQGMLGATIKAFYGRTGKWDPSKIVNVGVMPCTAKKFEIDRKEMQVDGIKDMDYVLTTRECAKILKMGNIDLPKLQGMDYDHPMGTGSGAGMIFGVTGGVMEAALRTGYEAFTGQSVPFKHLDITPVRGMEGIREASIPITTTKPEFKFLEGKVLKVAVAHGLANAKKLMENIKEIEAKGEECPWHFIEVMACPGGCLGGGGQPKPTGKDVREKRAKLVYEEDKALPVRKSHENPEIIQIYKELYGSPCSEIAHKYLHTHYDDKSVRHSQFVNMEESKKYSEFLEKHFKKGDRQYLLEIFLSIVDEFGYISDCSLVEAAKYTGVSPIEALSTATAYNYLPLEKVGDTVVYICQCQNCIMKGAKKVEQKMEELMKIKIGGTTADGKFSLKRTNWLGWCVNDAPAIMIKKKGSDQVIPVLKANNINSLSDIEKSVNNTPDNKIVSIGNKQHPCSFFGSINIDFTIQKFLQLSKEDLVKMLEDTRLLGRGGAGFPSFIKWRSVLTDRSKEKYVVINADEGLPSTFKDWCIMTDPQNLQKMLLGSLFCAETVNAKKIFLYLRYEYRNLKQNIYNVVSDLKARMKINTEFEIRIGGGPYIAGEETALFESIEGKGARPRADRRKFPTQEGLFKKPTVINNVETFAAVPIIITQGVDCWNQAQIKDFPQKGMKLFNICGDVETPILCEFPLGTTLKTILQTVKPHGEIIAAEVGGSTEEIILKKQFDTPLAFMKGALNAVGSIVLFNSTRNILDIYHQKLEFMKDESCKQCVPCRDGSVILAKLLEDVIHKTKNYKPSQEMAKLIADSAEITSICGHGKALGSLFKAVDQFLNNSIHH